MSLSHLQHSPDYQIASHHLLPPNVEFGYGIEDSLRLFLKFDIHNENMQFLIESHTSILLLVNIYFLIIYQYRLEIRQHCNQSASAFVQVRLSRDVCYVTLVRSSSHRAQYEPNRGVKTKHKKNCSY